MRVPKEPHEHTLNAQVVLLEYLVDNGFSSVSQLYDDLVDRTCQKRQFWSTLKAIAKAAGLVRHQDTMFHEPNPICLITEKGHRFLEIAKKEGTVASWHEVVVNGK